MANDVSILHEAGESLEITNETSMTKPRRAPRNECVDTNNQTDDVLSAGMNALKVSPSSSSTSTASSSECVPAKKAPSKKRNKSKRKQQVAVEPEAPVSRALNASEMSLLQLLMSGNNQMIVVEEEKKAVKRTTKKSNKSNDPVDKRSFLFSGLPSNVREQLQLDEVAQYSVTDMKTAARISHFIMTLPGLTPNSVITDATACVGGNTASFCTFFRYVQAVEIDATRFRMLVHNMHSVLSFVNLQCYCANYVQVAQQFLQDVVFIDPPWGGPEYRSRSTVDLNLGDASLAEVCELLVGRTQYVVIKVPQNFDIERFTHRVSGVVSYITHFRKMAMVVVDYRYVHPEELSNNN
ncbi:hypothetical protein THRCLA_00909 [Thraustotheca clavata]|uniref:Trimethylguanosine synthase n=1 Tax=Thraustotheca clavata TaxID=74557 RepID=A0A1W0A9W3_9STRA|nr:hypothetical protein THRCLA_00909 [Thraustotheca clavata]